MKKLIFIILTALVVSFPIFATIYYVPSQYPTIQSAVNAAQAGDTVMVAAGTYHEHVGITTSLYILGENMFNTIVDADEEDHCFLVNNVPHSYGKISGFTLTNSGNTNLDQAASAIAIATSGSGNWEISWNYIKDNPQIGILSYDGGTITRNIIEHNGYNSSPPYYFDYGIFVSTSSSNTIINNDFRDNETAIGAHANTTSIDIRNNIITDNTTGIDLNIGNFNIDYNDVWNNTTNYWGCFPGMGDISIDPQYIGGTPFDYSLSATSPCIDAGDPNSPLDPDNTIADMGVIFYNQGGGPLTVTLTPFNPPIQIPANGGSFEFNIAAANSGTSPFTFDIWTMATLPDGSEYGPIIGPVSLTVEPGMSVDRDRIQGVPAGAAAGNYTYDGYVGMYLISVWNEDHFDFEKLSFDDGAELVSDWHNWGEDFYNISREGNLFDLTHSPQEYCDFSINPNPFNPITNLSFTLNIAGKVTLTIYDIQGREISTIIDGFYQAGTHEAAFDGSVFSSGVYFAVLKTPIELKTQKLLLVK